MTQQLPFLALLPLAACGASGAGSSQRHRSRQRLFRAHVGAERGRAQRRPLPRDPRRRARLPGG
ncbi:hypothetical protein AB5I41_20735 [Sphingomonas sp. MMS24-JH45]